MLVALARLGNPETVGQFSLALAIIGPVMLFAGLQLRAVQATDARRLFEFADYAGTRVVTTAAALLLILLVSVMAHRGETSATICAFALSKGVESLSDVIYGFWQQHERMDLIAQSLVLRGILSLVALTAVFALSRAVWLSVCGVAAAWIAVLVGFDIPRTARLLPSLHDFRLLRPRYHLSAIRRLFRLSISLALVSMLLSLNLNFPRYVLEHFRGVRELGVYSALAALLLAGNTLVNAVGQSATPRLARYFLTGKIEAFRSLLDRLILIGIALGAAGVGVAAFAGRPVLAALYGKEYAGHGAVLLWLMIAGAIGNAAALSGYALTATRQFAVQLPLFRTVAAITVLGCIVLIPGSGARGAAEAIGLASMVQFGLAIALVYRALVTAPAIAS
jgi:O-antigen/teichoic acid export membrane protein